jgi:thioredoxin reductase
MNPSRRIVILGAGPAGLSAALWLRNLGFEPRVIETTSRAGGLQNLNFLANDWVLGQTGQTGPMLAARFVDHAAAVGIAVRTGTRLKRLDGMTGHFRAILDGADDIECGALLIATGTRFRGEEMLADVDGVRDLAPGRIAYGPYAFDDLAALAGQRVLIIGGGDNAYENARLLASQAAIVYLAVRSRPRAQQALTSAIAAAQATGRCRVVQSARVRKMIECGSGVEVTVDTPTTVERIIVDRINVLAGYEPNTGFLADTLPGQLNSAVRIDAQGYLITDGASRTGAPGIYAAGDVCNPRFPSVVSAVAQGALAARTIEMDVRMP